MPVPNIRQRLCSKQFTNAVNLAPFPVCNASNRQTSVVILNVFIIPFYFSLFYLYMFQLMEGHRHSVSSTTAHPHDVLFSWMTETFVNGRLFLSHAGTSTAPDASAAC